MSAAANKSSVPKKISRINLMLSAVIALCVAIAGYVVFTTLASPTTSLYMQPSSGTYNAGSTVTVTIRTNTGGESVNAVQANFSYPADYLQFQGIDSSGSAFGIPASETHSSGSVSIARGNISSVSGDLLVSRVTFKALSKNGSANLGFTSGSAVVRSSDSQNVLSITNGASYTIQIPSTPTPNPDPTPTPAPTPNPSPSPTPSPTPPSSGGSPTPTNPDTGGGMAEPDPTTGVPTSPDDGTGTGTPIAVDDGEPFDEPSYFFGLSNQTVLAAGVGVPLAIALLAGAVIYLRWRGSSKILQSGHNFKVSAFSALDGSKDEVQAEPVQQMVQPQVTTPTDTATDPVHAQEPVSTPGPIEPAFKVADQPLQSEAPVEDNVIRPTETADGSGEAADSSDSEPRQYMQEQPSSNEQETPSVDSQNDSQDTPKV